MGQYNNIYDKIQELLGNIPGNVSILEQQIDADVQLEYYNYAKKYTDSFNPEEVLKNRETIFGHDLTVDDKKHLLVQLANIDSIEAYRTLEKYLHGTHDQLKDWATLALKECRLLLECKLLDESQVLISTGLGGKGLKLRYFTVLLTTNGNYYSAFEKKIVKDEVRFTIKKSKGETERINFDKELCTILSIIPLQVPVQGLFDELIHECNYYGDFINTDYIITNVKIIPNKQIREMIGHARLKSKTRKE
jgi:hypothetical protein